MESSQKKLLNQQNRVKNIAAEKVKDMGQSTRYCQLVLFVMEIASSVTKEFIKTNILQKGEEFEYFLNLKNVKESFIHFYNVVACCVCSETADKKQKHTKVLTKKQLNKLYKEDPKKKNQLHMKRGKYNKIAQDCICSYSANENIQIDDLDITLANYVIQAATTSHFDVINNWIPQIIKVRNRIFHQSDIKEFTAKEFNVHWNTLKACVIGIAKTTDKNYAAEIMGKIHDLSQREVSTTSTAIPYERLCLEYWNIKKLELEKNQEDECAAMESRVQDVFEMSRLTTEDHEEIAKTIQFLRSNVENTTIYVNVTGKQFNEPSSQNDGDNGNDVAVLLHLEIPLGWDRDKIIEAVSNIRLQGNTAMQIKAISSKDLNIVVNMKNNLLCDEQELKSGVQETMSSILSEAGINTKETSEMTIDILIPKTIDSLEQVVKYHSGCIEVTILKKFNIERPRYSSAFDKSTIPVSHLDLNIFDCLLISGLIVITDYRNSQLLINSIDGHKNRTIPLNGHPRCMSIIKDYHIAVSYIKPIELASGKVGNIDIIDINNGLETTIENVWEVGCMTYEDGLLFVVIDGREITVMNQTGQVVRWFPCPSLNISNISSAQNLLYLTDSGINKLFCCDLFGRLIWEFKDDNMKMPSSVTVDRNHNVYVTSDRSKNVVILSPDGKCLKELLPKDIDVLFPIMIRYDTANDHLLAYNFFRGDACILDIKHLLEPVKTTCKTKDTVTLQCA